MTRRTSAVLLVASGLLAAALSCPLQTVQISKPRVGLLSDDPTLAIDVKVGRNFVFTSAAVRVDGVDLIAALGLTPPFADASGSVTIGSDLVAVTGFSYAIPSASDPIAITATLSGLSAGDHVVEADALPQNGGAATGKSTAFAVVEPFTREADVIASSGTPPLGPITGGNHAGVASLGEPLAAPPVALAGGGALRAGFVPVAHGRAAAP
jgi:hypothetical protein